MASNNCRKFVPNMFNKSKCQGCFKPKESHSAEALESSKIARKVSKCGYLFLNPDFDLNNPLQRTRRWQRRFFVLYDDGELTWAVDQMADTVPQGTIDMNKCTDVFDSENKTGHEFSIGVSTNNKTNYIKGTSKEEIRRWHDVLVMYPRSLKIKQKHKRNTTVVTTPIRAPEEKQADPPSKDSGVNGSSVQPRAKRHHTTDNFSTITNRVGDIITPIDLVRYEAERSSNRKRDERLLELSRSRSEAYVKDRSYNPEEDEDDDEESEEDSEEDDSEEEDSETEEEEEPEPPARPPPPQESTYEPQSYRSVRSLKHKSDRTRDGLHKSSSMHEMHDDLSKNGSKLSELKRSRDDLSIDTSQRDEFGVDDTDDLDMDGKRAKNLFESLTSPDKSAEPKIPSIRRSSNTKVLPYKEFASVPKIKHIEDYVGAEEKERRRSLPGGVDSQEKVDAALNDLRNRPHGGSFRQPKSPSPVRNYGLSIAMKTKDGDDGRSSCEASPRSHDSYSSRESLGSLKKTNDTDEKKLTLSPESSPVSTTLLDDELEDGNFVKKGWLVKQGSNDRDWSKHWFILSGTGLRYYKDAMAEDNNILDGRIDLSTALEVSIASVSRSYGFEIKSQDGNHILSAMTLGIRRNWIEAIDNCIKKNKSRNTSDQATSVSVEYRKDYSKRIDNDRVRSQPADEPSDKSHASKRVSAPPSLKTETRGIGGHYPARNSEQVKSIDEATTEARSISRRRSSSSESIESPSTVVLNNKTPSSTQRPQESPRHNQDNEDDEVLPPPSMSHEDKQALKDMEKSLRQLNRRSSGNNLLPAYKPQHLEKFESGEAFTELSAHQKPKQVDDFIAHERSSSLDSTGRLYERKPSASFHNKAPAMMSPSERLLARSRSGSPRPKSPPPDMMNDEAFFNQYNIVEIIQDPPVSSQNENKSTKELVAEKRQQLNQDSASGEAVLVDLLETQVDTLKSQLERTQQEMSKLQDDNVDLKTQLNAGRRSHRESLEDFGTDSTRYLSQILEMQEEAEETSQLLHAKLSSQQTRSDTTDRQVETLKRQISDANDIINRQQSEIGSIQGKLQLSNSHLLETESALTQAAKNLNSEREAVKKLTADLRKIQKQDGGKDDELIRLKNKLEKSDKLCKEKTASLEKLRKELTEKNKLVKDMNKEVAELRNVESDLQDKSTKLQTVEKLLSNTRRLLEENVENMRENESHYQAKIEEMETEFVDKRKLLDEKIRLLEQKLERFQKQSNIVDSLNVDMADILREKDETIADLEDKLSDAQKQVDDLSEELNSELEENSVRQENGERLDKDCGMLRQHIDVMQNRIVTLEKELTDSRSENARLKENLLWQTEAAESSRSECLRLKEEMTLLENLVDKFKDKIIHSESNGQNGNEALDLAIGDLTYSGKIDSKSSSDSISKEYYELKSKYDKSIQAIKKLQSRLQKSQESHNDLETSHTVLRQHMNSMDGKMGSRTEDLNNMLLGSAIEHTDATIRKLPDVFAQCQATVSGILGDMNSLRMDEKTDVMKNIENKLTAVDELLQKLSKSHEKYVPDVQSKLRHYAEKLSLEAVVLGQLAYLTKQKHSVQDSLQDYEQSQLQIENLQTELINSENDNEVQKNRLKSLQQESLVTYASLLADKMIVMGELEMVMRQLKQKEENISEQLSEISCASVSSQEAAIRADVSEALFSEEGNASESLVTRAVVEGEISYMLDKVSRRGSLPNENQDVELLKQQLDTVQQKLEERDNNLEQMIEKFQGEKVTQLATAVARDATNQALEQLNKKRDTSNIQLALKEELDKAFQDIKNKNINDMQLSLSEGNEKPKRISQFADMLAQQALVAGQVAYLTKRVHNSSLQSCHQILQKNDSGVHSQHETPVTSPSGRPNVTDESALDVMSSGLITQATQKALMSQQLESYAERGFKTEDKLESKIGKLAKSLSDIDQELSPFERTAQDYADKLSREIVFQAELSYVLYRVKLHYDGEMEQLKQSQGGDLGSGLDQSEAVYALRQDLEDAEVTLQRVTSEKSELEEEYMSKMAAFDDEIRHLHSKHQKELDESKADMKMVLKSVRASERNSGSDLVKEIRELEEEMEKERTKHKAEVERLMSRLKTGSESEHMLCLQDRIEEVETELREVQDEYEDELAQQRESYEKDLGKLREEVLSLRASAETSHIEVDDDFMRKRYEKEIDTLKGLCGQGNVDTERSYRKMMQEVRQQHKEEMEQLRQEKDQLLEEESSATQAALEALKKVNEAELAKEKRRFQELASKMFTNKDVETIEKEHDQEIEMVRSEMKLLSEQYSIKCIENATLAGKLEAQGKTLQQSRTQIHQLSARNEEMHAQLVQEIEKLKKSMNSPRKPDDNDPKQVHDLKITLQLKEVETKELKEEIKLLKEHLQAAEEDKEHHDNLHAQYQRRISQHETRLHDLSFQLAAGRHHGTPLHNDSPVVKHRRFKGFESTPRSRSPSPRRRDSPERVKGKRQRKELTRSKSSPGIPRVLLSAVNDAVNQPLRQYSMDDTTSRLSRYEHFRQTGGISLAERMKKFEA